MIYVVDTHALVWYFARDARLGSVAEQVLDSPDSTLVIPTIVLAELKYLSSRRRIVPAFDYIAESLEMDSRCCLEDLNDSSARLMPDELDIHDAIICSTALSYVGESEEDVRLVTRDEEIVAWGKVETVW
ncbi:MAG: hypothetical protein AUJ92_17330 [Armatimonadetes bacterium CG2_30_59_28]|nr:type II toxin-antitoxin system VapC family toxin [Armatimonadota bacterium]OIO91026.1 MAG: hypothetical protein AUJ92_17330 [Armatimonadetes bacterium CG2_30_59_28]PIU63170.1 MAG: hypothetical protein COS85_16575 [Armatimonadetes bacterium CG07_land_8_20_14_0_80_59_28]PIX43635.1 MAG: hypothetical protein COZ56_06755 [Armatimonadetes bacterium CG_4_8_14_3_um_filter_58_9]PIY49433.1 MAG: hypothetical protein COZ05_00425 [Armatimonadetes bacterium CG_4_10_14_3_um_filter_59_10]PJB76492.1 MAG: hy